MEEQEEPAKDGKLQISDDNINGVPPQPVPVEITKPTYMEDLKAYVQRVSAEIKAARDTVDKSNEIKKRFSPLKQRKMNPHTCCDYGKNEMCRKHLCVFILELHSHHEMVKDAIVRLFDLAERIWVLATRYNILESGKPFYQIYPEIITKHVECEMINEKNAKMNQICFIINDMIASYNKLDEKRNRFINYSKTLDWNTPAAFIVGDELEKPLEYYVNGASDLLFYFNVHQSLVKRTAMEISLESCDSLKTFQKSLELDKYFLVYLNALINYSNCAPASCPEPKTLLENKELNKN